MLTVLVVAVVCAVVSAAVGTEIVIVAADRVRRRSVPLSGLVLVGGTVLTGVGLALLTVYVLERMT